MAARARRAAAARDLVAAIAFGERVEALYLLSPDWRYAARAPLLLGRAFYVL